MPLVLWRLCIKLKAEFAFLGLIWVQARIEVIPLYVLWYGKGDCRVFFWRVSTSPPCTLYFSIMIVTMLARVVISYKGIREWPLHVK